MSTIHIYHHGDLDGKTAGACIYHILNIPGFDNKVLYNLYNYTIPLDLHNVQKDDIIFLVDYSLSNIDNIKRLAGLCKDYWEGEEEYHVFWLDHHKTSFNNIDTYPLNKINKVIDTDRCGAAISYIVARMYLNSITESDNQSDCIEKLIDIIKEVDLEGIEHYYNYYENMFIDFVDDWDRWKLEHEHISAFNLGALMACGNPTSENFETVLCSPGKGSVLIDLCLDYGLVIEEYLEQDNTQKLSEMGFECNLIFNDIPYRCICYNGRGNSKTFGHLIDDFDICVMFYYVGDQFIYSLYSKDVDTSEISLVMGGGGHPGASGFQNKELLFKKDGTLNILKDDDKVFVSQL